MEKTVSSEMNEHRSWSIAAVIVFTFVDDVFVQFHFYFHVVYVVKKSSRHKATL